MTGRLAARRSRRPRGAARRDRARMRRWCQVVRLEEALGPVVGLGLHVLAEGQRHRAAVGRVGHRAEGARQRGQQLLGPGDAVEIAADRPEAVVGADRAVAEILDLLQHRVGAAAGEDVAGQQQHRQAVHMGQRRGGHHVGRARPDRGGDRHRAAAAQLLGIGDRRMRHGLLVVAALGRQRCRARRTAPRRGPPRCRGRRSPRRRR